MSLSLIKKLALSCGLALALSACSHSDAIYPGEDEYWGTTNTYKTAEQADLDKYAGDKVYFDYDTSSLSADAKAILAQQAEWLKNHPTMKVMIEGHCDPRGTREYNLGLGERRANIVKRQLERDGIKSDRLSTISYGKERPAVEGDTEESYRLDRRAVTVVR